MDLPRPSDSNVTLPTDCICSIVGHLPFDHDSLRRCALVCHLWAYLCQQRLFNYICIPIHAHSGESTGPVHRLAGLLSRSPHIGGHVRSLRIDIRMDPGTGHFNAEQQAMAIVLPRLHQLSTLTINGPGNSGFEFSPPLFDALRTTIASPQLTHLALSKWPFPGPHAMTSLMGEYPQSLDSLKLTAVVFNTSPSPSHEISDAEPATAIKSFDVDSCNLLDVTNWIKSSPVSVTVRKLTLRNILVNSIPPFVQLFSPDLQELTLPGLDLDRLPVPLNLGDLGRLRVLSLNHWNPTYLLDSLDAFRQSRSLETMDILLSSIVVTSSMSPGLKQLDKVLGSTHIFPSLKSVKLRIRVLKAHRVQSIKVIEEALPLLIARGLLYLEDLSFVSESGVASML